MVIALLHAWLLPGCVRCSEVKIYGVESEKVGGAPHEVWPIVERALEAKGVALESLWPTRGAKIVVDGFEGEIKVYSGSPWPGGAATSVIELSSELGHTRATSLLHELATDVQLARDR